MLEHLESLILVVVPVCGVGTDCSCSYSHIHNLGCRAGLWTQTLCDGDRRLAAAADGIVGTEEKSSSVATAVHVSGSAPAAW